MIRRPLCVCSDTGFPLPGRGVDNRTAVLVFGVLHF